MDRKDAEYLSHALKQPHSQISLFFSAAFSLSAVSRDGDQKEVLSLPLADAVRIEVSGNTKSLTRLIKPAVNSGNKASLSTAILADI